MLFAQSPKRDILDFFLSDSAAMPRVPWTTEFAAGASKTSLAPGRFLRDFLASKSDRVQRALVALRDARHDEPTMAAIRAVYCHSADTQRTNHDLVAGLLAAYIVARHNRLRDRQGQPRVEVPATLQQHHKARNPVAELMQSVGEVSLDAATRSLQLHNAHMSDDPYSIEFAAWYSDVLAEHGVVASDPTVKIAFLRTCIVALRGRAVGVLSYFRGAGLLLEPGDLARFIMEYSGPVGDGATQEASARMSPEEYVTWSWSTFRPEGVASLKRLLICRSNADAIGCLTAFNGFGGTKFSAKTVVHFICDADRRHRFLGLREDDYRGTGIGPNPRKLINLIEGRDFHACARGGEDEFYLLQMRKITGAVRALLPPGADYSFVRKYGTIRSCQFNACKLLICLQFVLTGKYGKHRRKTRVGLMDADAETSCSEDEGPGRRVRRRVKGPE